MEVPLRSVPKRESARAKSVPDEALSFEVFVQAENVRLFRALFLVTGDGHEGPGARPYGLGPTPAKAARATR